MLFFYKNLKLYEMTTRFKAIPKINIKTPNIFYAYVPGLQPFILRRFEFSTCYNDTANHLLKIMCS